MRSSLALTAVALMLGGVAQAQTPSAPPAQIPPAAPRTAQPPATADKFVDDTRYVQAVADLAFGNVGSQSYGAEGGFTVRPHLQVFVEGGRVNNVAGSAVGDAAHVIAQFLAQSQSSVSVLVKEPVSFVAGGVRYLVPMAGSRAQPYVMGGFGVASVKQDVTFKVGGNDVTGILSQLGVVLGSDLSGTFTKPMLTLGGGVAVPVWQRVVLDLHFRFGRILAEEQGINVGRAGIGLGFRF